MFALKGSRSGDLLTLNGKVIVHDNERELQFLFRGAEPVKVSIRPEEALPLWAHPDMAGIKFPLEKKDFKA